MGFFQDLSNTLFGGKTKSESTSDTSQVQEQTQTQTQTQQQTQNQATAQTQATQATSTQTGTQTGAQTQVGTTGQTGVTKTSTLDPAILALLRDKIIPGLAGAGATGGAGDVAAIRGIGGKLELQAGTNVEQDIAAVQAAAKQDFAQNEGAQIAGLQQQIGSKGNSYSQLIQQQGNVALQTTLASLAAQMRSTARGQSDQELVAALDAASKASGVENANTAAPLQNLLAAIQALSGAETTSQAEQTGTSTATGTQTGGTTQTGTSGQTSTGSGVSTESQSMISTLDALAQAAAQGNTVTQGQVYENKGILNNIVSLFK